MICKVLMSQYDRDVGLRGLSLHAAFPCRCAGHANRFVKIDEAEENDEKGTQ